MAFKLNKSKQQKSVLNELNIDKSLQSAITTLAIPTIIIAICLVGILYFQEQRAYNNKVIDVRTEARNVAVGNLTSINNLKNSFSDLEQSDHTSKDVLDALPSKYDYSAIATSIEKLVKENGLTFSNFSSVDNSGSAVDSQPEPNPVAQDFSLTVEGSYIELRDFFRVLERSIRPIQIKSVSIAGEDNQKLRAEISASTFYQPSESLEKSTKAVQK